MKCCTTAGRDRLQSTLEAPATWELQMRFIFALLASLVSAHAMAARLELTGPTLFYVSTVSGNDAKDGLTPSTPKLTTNAMLAVLQANYDFKCNDVQVLHAV